MFDYYRFFEWETLKGGKKQPYYIYFKKDANFKVEVKEEEISSHEGGKHHGKVASSHKPDVKDVNIIDEPVTLTKVKEEDAVCCEDRHLLTMAGLFDCWQAPKVLHPEMILIANVCNWLITELQLPKGP